MFGFWEAWIIVGTFWFWVPLFGFMIWAFIGIAQDHGPGTTLPILLAVLFLAVATNINPLAYVWNYPIESLLWAGAYIAVGLTWCFVKWSFYLLNRRDEARAIKKKWMQKGNNSEEFNEWMIQNLNSYNSNLREFGVYNDLSYPPNASQHKDDIIFWMSYWPFSFIWTFLNDPLRRMWIWLQEKFSGSMQRISNAIFKSI